ncbi:hypothetical protein ACHHYP_16857 [Achlya hypogyna]|uniref:FYVE-type domain-containing protein n=1 Tax=Achlya hypogyna TaxID=1202772 RepID=A0A1V9Y5M3_ACHHY|nr:hypothetical protein ACHHYP_16857 [Achlya hypogyna]
MPSKDDTYLPMSVHEQPATLLTAEMLLPVEKWVPLDDRHMCGVCERDFSVYLQKHHCRKCGEVVCNTCTEYKPVSFPDRHEVNDVMVCKPCIQKLDGSATPSWNVPVPNMPQLEFPSDVTKAKFDDESDACHVCKREFSMFRWKYHCRWCTKGVCNECRPAKPEKSLGIQEGKVCLACILAETKMTVLWDDRWYPHGDLVHTAVDHAHAPADELDAPLDYSWGFPWPKPPVLPHEKERLAVLRGLQLLDTPPEDAFDAVCDFASNGLGCPMAAIGFVDEHREWFKAQVGLAQREIPRNISFTAHAIRSKESLVVLDTLRDKRFYKNPMVTNVAAIRFFAVAPIITAAGVILGAVFVLDTRPRESFDVATLERLARVAMTNIEDRKATEVPDDDDGDCFSPTMLSPIRPSSSVQTLSEHTSSHSNHSSLHDQIAQLTTQDEPVLVITAAELLRRDDWAPSAVRSSCERCHQPFSMLRHRHHCHTCGEVFCSTCLVENMAERPGGIGVQKVNVCSTCLSIATVLGNFKHSRAMRKAVLETLGKPGIEWRHNKRPSSKTGEFANKLEQIKRLEERDSIALRSLLNPDQYTSFAGTSKCNVCSRKYSMFVHKHHCSVCGEVVCVSCTVKKFLQLPNRQEWPQVTVCVSCELSRLTTHDGDQASDLYTFQSNSSRRVGALAKTRGVSIALVASSTFPFGMLSIDQLCPQSQWVPLAERPRCVRCNTSFALFRRGHHCRLCGEVVCRACTTKRTVRHRTQAKVTDVPVCTNCCAPPKTFTKKRQGLQVASPPPPGNQCHHDGSINADGHCRPNIPNKKLGVKDGKVCLKCLLQRTHEVMGTSAPPPQQHKITRGPESPSTDTMSSFGSATTTAYPLDFSWGRPWPKPPILADEPQRLEALRRCDILDTLPEDVFEIICDLAIKATGCPMAAVAFLDADRLWFKARMGLAQSQLPRDVAFCAHTIVSCEPLVVLDTLLDMRFVKNPLVAGKAKIRFYAATPDNYVLGTVFVLDSKPRDEFDVRSLKKLSNIATAHIKMNKKGMADAPIDVLLPRDLVPAADWSPANRSSRCATCTRSFSIFRRKRHCHTCGEVVCKTCITEAPVAGQSLLVFVCMRCSLKRRRSTSSKVESGRLPTGCISTIHEIPEAKSSMPEENLLLFELAVAPRSDEETLKTNELATELVPLISRLRCDHCRHVLLFRHRLNCQACGEVVCRRCILPQVFRIAGRKHPIQVNVCATCQHLHDTLGSYSECRVYKPVLGSTAYPPGVHVPPRFLAPPGIEPEAFARKLASFKSAEEAKLVPEEYMLRRDVSAFCKTCAWERFARLPARHELDVVLVCSKCLITFEHENRLRRAYLLADCLTIYAKACGVGSPKADASYFEQLDEATHTQRRILGGNQGGGTMVMETTENAVGNTVGDEEEQHIERLLCGNVICNACAIETPVIGQRYDVLVCTSCTSARLPQRPVVVDTIFHGTLYDPTEFAAPTSATNSGATESSGNSTATTAPVTMAKTKKDVGNLNEYQLHVVSETPSPPAVISVDYDATDADDFCFSTPAGIAARCVTSHVVQTGRRLGGADICRTCTIIYGMFGSFKECRWIKKSLSPTAYPPGVQVSLRCPLYVNRHDFARRIAELKYLEEIDLVPWNHLPHKFNIWTPEASICNECDTKLHRATRTRCSMCDLVFCAGCTTVKFTRLPHKLELTDVYICASCVRTFNRWNQSRNLKLWRTCAEVYAKASGTHVDASVAPSATSPGGWVRTRQSLERNRLSLELHRTSVDRQADHHSLESASPYQESTLGVPPSRCTCCNRDFAFYRKRHHCHECGADVCKACMTPRGPHHCPLKVCLPCLVEPTDSQRGREASKRSQRSTSDASSFASRDGGYALDFNWIYPWPKPPVVTQESERVNIVRCLDVLDSPRNDLFESICHLAASTLGASIAIVSVLDSDREWVIDSVGFETREVPRDASFCAHAIRSAEPTVVLDTLLDERFAQNPLVTGPFRIRFYAGYPIVAPSGIVVGTVAVLHDAPFKTVDRCRLMSIEELTDSDADVGRTSRHTNNWAYPWKQPPVMASESDRLAELQRYDVLDTPPERVFDVVCELASSVLGCPMAAVTFIDSDRQWFKSRLGLLDAEISRDIAICAHTVACGEPLVVLDASKDKKFALNPLVLGVTGMRFYAGAPIVTKTGHAIGTVCVFDTRPHTSVDVATLERLANVALLHLEDRRTSSVAPSTTELATANVFEEPVLSMAELLRRRDCVPKTDRICCGRCRRAFSLFRHKKHCRACGEVFCSFCTVPARAQQRRGPRVFKVHVCTTCVNIGSVLGHFRLCCSVRKSLFEANAADVVTADELEQIQELEDKDTLTPHRLVSCSDCVPFDERGCCHVCNRNFNIFRSKYSCRVCGDVVCSGCAKKKLASVAGTDEMAPVNVCVECLVDLSNRALQHIAGGMWPLETAATMDYESLNNSRKERSSMKCAIDTVKTLLVSTDERASSRTSLPEKQLMAGRRQPETNTYYFSNMHTAIPADELASEEHRCGEVVCGPCLVSRRAQAIDKDFDVGICVACVAVYEQHTHIDAHCFVCTRPFSILRRQHRCDKCGEGVCRGCSVVQRDHGHKLVRQLRICTNCSVGGEPPKHRPGVSEIARLYETDPAVTLEEPPMPVNDADRVRDLESYGLLDTPHERVLDVDCRLASKLLGCPIAGLSLMHTHRQWFKAQVGFNQTEVPRAVSFGAHVIASSQPLVVLDTLVDDRFANNPIVTGPAKIRFYAGAPIVTPRGHVIGTVFVMNTVPQASCNIKPLQQLASVVMRNMEQHKSSLHTDI